DHPELTRFHAAASAVRVAPLFHRANARMFEIAESLDAWAVNLSEKLATADRLAAIADHGYRSLVYTINNPAIADRLRDDGAGGIFTDFPDRMRRFRS